MIEALPMDDRGSSLIQIHSWQWLPLTPPPKNRWWTWTNYIRSPSPDLPKICIFLCSNHFSHIFVSLQKKNDWVQPMARTIPGCPSSIHQRSTTKRLAGGGTTFRFDTAQGLFLLPKGLGGSGGIRVEGRMRLSPLKESNKGIRTWKQFPISTEKKHISMGKLFFGWRFWRGVVCVWWKKLFRSSGLSHKIHESFMKWDGIEDVFGVEISVTR